jgi:hypothetical protein
MFDDLVAPARNRSRDPVVSCFFGRIVPSDAAHRIMTRDSQKSQKNEIARFRGLGPRNLAIQTNLRARKTTLAQALSSSSQATRYGRLGGDGRLSSRPHDTHREIRAFLT